LKKKRLSAFLLDFDGTNYYKRHGFFGDHPVQKGASCAFTWGWHCLSPLLVSSK